MDKSYLNKPYLLTYKVAGKGYGTFSWFETEEKMNEFIDNTKGINVLEAFYIKDVEAILYY